MYKDIYYSMVYKKNGHDTRSNKKKMNKDIKEQLEDKETQMANNKYPSS